MDLDKFKLAAAAALVKRQAKIIERLTLLVDEARRDVSIKTEDLINKHLDGLVEAASQLPIAGGVLKEAGKSLLGKIFKEDKKDDKKD